MNIRSKLFYGYVCSVLLYAASFLLPRSIASMRTYDLSVWRYRLLSLTVLVPLCVIWYAAFYGYDKLRTYASTIRNTPDGRHIAKLTTGVMILAIGLPIASLSSSAVSVLSAHSAHWLGPATIVRNYLTLLFPLAGFLYISKGAYGLSTLAKQRPSYRGVNTLAVLFITLALVYSYVILRFQNLEMFYHMHTWLVLSTIAVPYLMTWYLGLLSAYEIYLYSLKAPGLLYRKTWKLFAVGIGSIILMQITVQYVTLVTVQFTHLRLLRLLIIVYVLLAGLSVGYILMALGAKRLQKIEEV